MRPELEDEMRIETVYMREPIGVDGALEAVQAIHFCSVDCREQWQNWHPDANVTDWRSR